MQAEVNQAFVMGPVMTRNGALTEIEVILA